LANILNTGFDNLMAAERRYKDHRYSRVALYIKLHAEANDKENFFGFEKQDNHILPRQEKRTKLKSHKAIMERNPYRKETEKTELQILTEDFLLSDIPHEVKTPVFDLATSLVRDIFQAAQNNTPIVEVLKQKQETLQQKGGIIFVGQPQPAETGQAPEFSEIPRWQGRKQDGMPLDFIQAHYGQWLSVFGAEQDTIFQDQIRKHDKRLITAIENQLREEEQGRKVRDFIKPRSARIDREVAAFTSESLNNAERLRAAKRRRQAKKQSFPNSSSQ
jgi:hypothetical protein